MGVNHMPRRAGAALLLGTALAVAGLILFNSPPQKIGQRELDISAPSSTRSGPHVAEVGAERQMPLRGDKSGENRRETTASAEMGNPAQPMKGVHIVELNTGEKMLVMDQTTSEEQTGMTGAETMSTTPEIVDRMLPNGDHMLELADSASTDSSPQPLTRTHSVDLGSGRKMLVMDDAVGATVPDTSQSESTVNPPEAGVVDHVTEDGKFWRERVGQSPSEPEQKATKAPAVRIVDVALGPDGRPQVPLVPEPNVLYRVASPSTVTRVR